MKKPCSRFAVTIFATTVCFIFLQRAIAMRILSRDNFKRRMVSNAIFHCGLMFIGIVILEAWPNEGFSKSGTYNRSKNNFLQDVEIDVF